MKPHRVLRTAWAGVLGLSVLLATAPPTSAYQTFGGHFATNHCLKWSYRNEILTDYKQAYKNALDSWANYSGATTCWTKVTGGTWQVGLDIVNDNSVGWDGLSDIHPGSGSVPYNWVSTEINRYYADPYSAGAKQSVLAHEIGHALGIAHPGSDGQAVLMNRFTFGSGSRWGTFSIKTPQTDEKNAINHIY